MDSINKIKDNYTQLEKSLVAQLFLETPTDHQLTTGTYREQIWANLFKQILPKKFSIEQGIFIIDSKKKVSKEVDLAIFDEQFTPYIFNYGNIKFIPIEAIAMVVQCKSNNIDNKNLKDWTDSIKLETSTKSITRMFQDVVEGEIKLDGPIKQLTQTATRPIIVLCHINGKEKAQSEKVKEGLFDIILCANENNNQLTITLDNNKLIKDWYKELNHCNKDYLSFIKPCNNEMTMGEFSVGNNSILSLIFQLNQLLMLINNPMLFPHQAYVSMFDNNKIR